MYKKSNNIDRLKNILTYIITNIQIYSIEKNIVYNKIKIELHSSYSKPTNHKTELFIFIMLIRLVINSKIN